MANKRINSVPGNINANEAILAKLNKGLCRLKINVARGIRSRIWSTGNQVKIDRCLISICFTISS